MNTAFLDNKLIVDNLLRWSLQIALLVAAGALVPRILRLKIPHPRLALGQLVLLICVLFPVLRPWRKEIVSVHSARVERAALAFAPEPAPKLRPVFSTSEALLAIAAAGCLLRVGMLLFGLARLRRYRVRSIPLAPAPTWSSEAEVRVSPDITGPVTFGLLKPVVLVPERFHGLSAEMQDAILCHEILHVRRHDWLFTVGEELTRALLWFHPAIWWLLREIQLVREEAVDRQVVHMMKSRDEYIDALLLFAGAAESDLAPAPLFLRKQHLKHRVASILKEVRVSRFQVHSAFATSLVLVAASCWFITGALPLHGAPQVVSDTSGVSVNTLGAELVFRTPILYPPDAIAKSVQGTVVASVKLDGSGNVTDASILSGPQELRKAVLQSVLNWRFSAAAAAVGTRELNVTFGTPPSGAQSAQSFSVLPSTPGAVIPLADRLVRSIKFVAVSDSTRAQMESRLPVHEGDTFTQEKNVALSKLAQEFDSHVAVLVIDRAPDPGVALMIMPKLPSQIPSDANFSPGVPPPPPPPPPQGARVTGGITTRAAVYPVSQMSPVYPELARAARVQGTVSFDATIGTDGTVKNLRVVSGPPLLVQAAMDAIKQWIYPPSATEVVTPVDITFTLPQ